jgi:hypothetical protein
MILRPPRTRLVEQLGKIGCAELPAGTERPFDARHCLDDAARSAALGVVGLREIKPRCFEIVLLVGL